MESPAILAVYSSASYSQLVGRSSKPPQSLSSAKPDFWFLISHDGYLLSSVLPAVAQPRVRASRTLFGMCIAVEFISCGLDLPELTAEQIDQGVVLYDVRDQAVDFVWCIYEHIRERRLSIGHMCQLVVVTRRGFYRSLR